MNLVIYIACCFLLLTVISCKERYELPAEAIVNTGFLVVEGNINVGPDSTKIRLSHVTPITDTTKAIVPEQGASVVAETDGGGSYALDEIETGIYEIPAIPAGGGAEKYRLHIKTAGGKEYLSDYVAFKKTPAIDSISWEQHDDGVHIYANAHDDANLTKYYKWDFVETWEYHSSFKSLYKYEGGQIVPRSGEQPFYTCYQTVASSAIILSATTKLSSDVVYKRELMFIPTSSYKIGVLYSIFVKQSVLTEAGFNYWNQLSKNTEQLGSLFDAQPSQLAGNIHAVSGPSETVIGFVTATSTEQQRLFIKKEQLNNWAYPPGAFSVCDTVNLDSPEKYLMLAGEGYLVIDRVQLTNPFSPYFAAPVDCVDCRLKGGVLGKPLFWP